MAGRSSKSDSPRNPRVGERGYRISDLAGLTGVPRETIKFYFRTGLLPRPSGRRGKWPLYSPAHIDLIRLVQLFQRQTRLTLPQIAEIFEAAGHNPETLELDLLSGKYEQAPGGTDIGPAAEASAVPIQLPPEFVARLRDHGLAPRHRNLTASEEQTAALILVGTQAGLPLSFYAGMQAEMDRIARAQLEAMLSVNLSVYSQDERARQIEETNRMVNRWLNREKDRLIWKHFGRTAESSRKSLEQVRSWVYLPGEAFLEKLGFARELERLEDESRRSRSRARCLPALAEAQAAAGKFGDAAKTARECLEAGQDSLPVLVAAIRAAEYEGDFGRSASLSDRVLKAYPHRPSALAAAASDCIYQASRLLRTAKGIDWMTRAGGLYARVVSLNPSDPRDQFDRSLFQGLSNALLPGVLGHAAEATQSLESALVQLDQGAGLGLPLASLAEIHRIVIHYYLGHLRRQAGDTKGAAREFREVIRRDPESNFGRAASDNLSRLQGAKTP